MAEWVEFRCMMCDWHGRIRVKAGADVSETLAQWGRAHNDDVGNPFGLLKVTARYRAVKIEGDADEPVVQEREGLPW